jgi:hypothetical protein
VSQMATSSFHAHRSPQWACVAKAASQQPPLGGSALTIQAATPAHQNGSLVMRHWTVSLSIWHARAFISGTRAAASAHADVPRRRSVRKGVRSGRIQCALSGVCCIRSEWTAKQTIEEIGAFEKKKRRNSAQRAPTIKTILIDAGGSRAHQFGEPPVGENQEARWIASESNRAGGPPPSVDLWIAA